MAGVETAMRRGRRNRGEARAERDSPLNLAINAQIRLTFCIQISFLPMSVQVGRTGEHQDWSRFDLKVWGTDSECWRGRLVRGPSSLYWACRQSDGDMAVGGKRI